MDILDCNGRKVPEDAIIIRATEVSQFLNCTRNWYFQSHNGMNLESVRKPQKLRFGTIWHLAMEYLYAGKDPFKGLEDGFKHEEELLQQELSAGLYDPDVQAGINEDKELASALLTAYMQWRNTDADPPDTSFSTYSVEERFVVPIPNTKAYVAAKLDAILMDKGNGFWVLEHKTRGKSTNVSTPPELQLDLQTGIQLWVLQKSLKDKGEGLMPAVVRGVIYNLARKQMPGARVKSPIFGRHEVHRSKDELLILQEYLEDIAGYIEAYQAFPKNDDGRPKYNKLRYNPSQFGICTWGCPVKDICEAINRGEDVEYLIQAQLKPREKSIWEVLQADMQADS